MGTLPPPATEQTSNDKLEKKVYDVVDRLSEYLPIINDRNRLGFGLYKLMRGDGDNPAELVLNSKLTIQGIAQEELVKKIESEINKLKSESQD